MSNEPFNLEAEKSVIGGLLIDGSKLIEISDMVKPDSFFSSQHKDIYSAILELSAQQRPFDLINLSDEMALRTGDDMFGYLGDIEHNTPSAANIFSYANIVAKNSKLREMILAHEQSIALLKSDEGTVSERLHQSIASVNAIDPDISGAELSSKIMDKVAEDWVDCYGERVENPDLRGMTTGMDSLDEIIGYRGLQGGDMIVIGARPKSYKTATMTKISNHIGLDLKKPVLTFSMEMQNNQIFERILTQETGVSGEKFHRQLNDDNEALVFNAISHLKDAPMYIDDRSNLTMGQIKREARGRAKELGGYGKLGAIMIDYFTLMSLGGNKQNPSFAYAQNSKEIVSLGKELGAPIFLLAQLNRECEKRPDKRPLVSDLGDTDQLGRDASLIIMLYNDSVYNDDSHMAGILEVIVRANRHGATGTAYQAISEGRLTDISPEKIGGMIAEAEYQERKKEESKKYGA